MGLKKLLAFLAPQYLKVKGLKRSISSSSIGSSSSSASNHEDADDFLQEHLDVPEGSFAVYVGANKRRFIVRTQHLKHPLLQVLLRKSAEEYGFNQRGALTIPCEESSFEHVLWLLNNSDQQVKSGCINNTELDNCSRRTTIWTQGNFTYSG